GTITVARSRENLDLERAARKLESLDREFQEAVRAFGEQPDEGCLNRLTDRRVDREAAAAELAAVRKEMQQLAPNGLGALERELDKLQSARQIIIERRADLVNWTPSEQDVSDRERQYQSQIAALQASRKEMEKAEAAANQELQKVQQRQR